MTDQLQLNISRRVMLLGMASAVTVAGSPAAASPEQALAQLKEWTGTGSAKAGRVKIVLPDIADNGNAVPIEVAVESPMTATDYVARIHIAADENPHPAIATFHLTPANGTAHVTTRIRLARSQRVTAWAVMSDGSVWGQRATVTVTIGGCGA